jgi:hypothetical protein
MSTIQINFVVVKNNNKIEDTSPTQERGHLHQQFQLQLNHYVVDHAKDGHLF